MKRIVAGGCLATTLLGLLGIAACGDDDAAGAAGAAAPAVEAGTAAPDATALPATAPVVTIVNDLTGYPNGNQARLCATVGGEQLFASSLLVPFGKATPLVLPIEAGVKLTGAVTFHLVPLSIIDACADAVKRTADGVITLPEVAAGSFVGSKPYAYMLLGCEADPSASLPAECSADATGTLPAAGVSTLRGRVVALDDGIVDGASLGLQFLRNGFHVDPTNGAPGKLRALATGGYNDGPKAIGGALSAFDPPAPKTRIPAVGFLAPSNGGFRLEDGTNAQTIRTVAASTFTGVTFAAGKSYVVTTIGQESLGSLGLLAFPTFPEPAAVGPTDPVTTGPQAFVSLFNDIHDATRPTTLGAFVPCFLTADGTPLNPSPAGAGAKVVRRFRPAPILTALGGRWATDEIRMVYIPTGSARACDANVAAAIGVDGVRVLATFARGTFELDRSYMIAMLGCTDPDTFANTPWCYGDWNGGSAGGTVAAGVRYIVYPVDGAPAASELRFQYMQASAYVQWNVGGVPAAPAALTGFARGTLARFDIGFSSYASAASSNPQLVATTATRLPDEFAANYARALLQLTVSDGNGGYQDAPFAPNGAFFADVETITTGALPTFTFFAKGHSYVVLSVPGGGVLTAPELVAVPTTW